MSTFDKFYTKTCDLIQNKYFLLVLLASAFLNPVLRFSTTNPYTVYRIIAPAIAIFYILKIKRISYSAIFLLTLLFYNVLASSFFSNDFFLNSNVYFLNYFYLFSLYFFYEILKEKFGFNFEKIYLQFLKAFVFFIYALFFFKKIFDIHIFYDYDTYFYNNTFYSTPNDLALAISAILIVLLSDRNIAFKEKLLHVSLIAYINYSNDSKSAFIANLITVTAYIGLVLLQKLLSLKPKYLFTQVALAFFSLGTLVVLFANKASLPFRDDNFKLGNFIIAPLNRILTLTPYRLSGSVYDRADSAIFALTEFFKTLGIGLGTKGSINVLETPYYATSTSKSLHNFILEWSVDFGLLFFFVCCFIALRFFKQLKNLRTIKQYDFLLFIFSAPFLSISQSSGFVSNYLFWGTTFFIFSRGFYAKN